MDSAKLLEKPLNLKELETLLYEVQHRLKEEKSIITVEGTVLVVGDLHGDFEAVKSIVGMWEKEGIDNVVFLGDYVDRGPQQLETINYLLALKLSYPDRVFLLRGNHETRSVNGYCGFLSVCREELGEKSDELYKKYNDLFSWLSPAALCKKIFMVHGGIPNNIQTLQDINSLKKGDETENDILGQLLWNDPSEDYPGFEKNWARGIHHTFGEEVFSTFLDKHNLDMVIRAHEVFPDGYKYFFEDKLLSIFSSPHYRGVNTAKVALIDDGVTLEEVAL